MPLSRHGVTGRLLKERESQKTFLFTLVEMNDESCYGSFADGERMRWRDYRSLQISLSGSLEAFLFGEEMKIILVLGGARSGKSTYALRLAEDSFDRPLYIATAEAGDREMAERIKTHKRSRSKHWKCVEEPLDISSVIASPPNCDGILVDCMTLWASNVLIQEGEKAFAKRTKTLIAALRETRRPVIIVSNEVGLGIVPEHELGRKFRDLAGRLNQELARIADTVMFVVSGLPMVLKGGIQNRKGNNA